MAKESKKKKSETEKSLTTSKAFQGIENVFDKLIARLPDNINVDAAKLTQMVCAGGAAYIFAEDVVKGTLAISASLGDIMSKTGDPPPWFLAGIIGGPVGALLAKLIAGETITDEEQAVIDAYKLTEEQKIGIALAAAALVPEAGDILKGIGEIMPL